MNHKNFMKWLEEQLIPNLPPNGIVVRHNAPYHSVRINKPPTQANRKEDIRSWLENNGVSTTSDMRKAELLMLVKNFPTTKTYYVDELLKKHGHVVVRLPPYHCELNPIELIWSMVKRKVAMNNVSQSNGDIEQLVRNAFTEITPQDWEKECNHVKHVADEMWQNDKLLDDQVEELMFVVNNGSADEDMDWTDCSSDDDSASD